MATETLQFEKQVIQTAEQELKQARTAFQEQLDRYLMVASEELEKTGEYKSSHSFWLK